MIPHSCRQWVRFLLCVRTAGISDAPRILKFSRIGAGEVPSLWYHFSSFYSVPTPDLMSTGPYAWRCHVREVTLFGRVSDVAEGET